MFYQYQQVCSTFVGIPDTDANFYPERADISLSTPLLEVEIYDRDWGGGGEGKWFEKKVKKWWAPKKNPP